MLSNRIKKIEQIEKAILTKSPLSVIDIEATCGPLFNRELTEIGWALVDIKSRRITDKQSLLTKPPSRKINKRCLKLNGISQEMVEDAPSFKSRMQALRSMRFRTGLKLWVSYGDFDPLLLKVQCRRSKLRYPLHHLTWIDLQRYAQLKLNCKQNLSLKDLLRQLNVPVKGTPHRAGSDAYNTANALLALLEL